MNLKQLEAFKAIMSTGSTIGAATRMGLSQSAVSRLLSQLEEALGFALFLRKKGRLMATPEAEELLAEVAEAEGYAIIGCDLWRERVGTKVRNSRKNDKTVRVREDILLLQRN